MKNSQKFLYETKIIKRLTAFMIAFSMIVVFVVPYAVTEPVKTVIAEGEGYSQTYDYFDQKLTDEQITAITTNLAYNLSNQITGISVKDNELAMTRDENGNWVITADKSPFDLSLILEYAFTDATASSHVIGTKNGDSYTGGNPYIYYQLPEQIRPTQNYFGSGSDHQIKDDNYNKDIPAGYFYVSTTGYVIIKFTDDYINYIRSKNGNFSGGVYFKGQVDRSDNQSGDQNITFNNTPLKIVFEDTKLSATKTGKIEKINGEACIRWTITLDNPGGYINLKDYVLTDKLNNALQSLKVTDDGNISNLQIEGLTSEQYTINDNGTITFNDCPKETRTDGVEIYPDTVTISYIQKGTSSVPIEDTDFTNEAVFEKTDEPTVTAQNDTPVKIENAYSITKTGVPDYQKEDKGTNNKIYWEIIAQNKSTESLAGAVITDTITGESAGSCSFADLEIYDSNNQKIDNPAVTISGNTLTFGDNFDYSYVKIVYSTDVTFPDGSTSGANITVNNSANIKNKNDGNSPTPADTGDIPVTYTKELYVNKKVDQNLNLDTNQVKWKIKIVSNAQSVDNGNINKDYNSKESLDGYIIEDSAFADIDISKITFNTSYSDNQWRGSDRITLTRVEGTTNQIRVTVNPDDNGTTPVLNELELFYYTTVSQEDRSATIHNDVNVSKGTNSAGSGVDYTYKEHKESNKSYIGYKVSETEDNFNNSDQESTRGTADITDRILKWQATLQKDLGFQNVVFKDELQQGTWAWQSDKTNPNIETPPKHYMTSEQLSNIKIYFKINNSDPWVYDDAHLLLSNCYTATLTEDRKSFTITFNENIDSSYRFVKIEYESTAETKDIPAGHGYSFNNKSGFNNETLNQVNGWTFNRDDVSTAKEIELKVAKHWNDFNNKLEKRTNSIQVQVMRTIAINGEIPDDAEWSPASELITIDLSSWWDGRADSLGKYPQWDIESGKMYCYKIVENSVAGYEQEYGDPLILEENNNLTNYTLSVTNKLAYPFKRAVNSGNKEITEATIGDVPVTYIDIDGVSTKCYVFGWELIVDKKSGQDPCVFTDTLPDDAVYINSATPGYTEGDKYRAKVYNEYYDGGTNNIWLFDFDGTASQSGKTLTFTALKEKSFVVIRYYTAIPVAKLNEKIKSGNNTLTNSFYVGEDSNTTYPASITLTGEIPPEVDYITKSARVSTAGGRLPYKIDFNPTAIKLNNNNRIDITDVLKLDNDSGKNLGDLKVSLDKSSVKVIQINSDNTETVLNTSQYGVRTVTVDNAETDASKFIISVPDGKHLRIEYTYDVSGYSSNDNIYFSNKSSFSTSNANGTSTEDHNKLNVSSSGGYVSTDTLPTIYKVDVNNIQINTLTATFKVAKYIGDGKNEKWLYASSVQDVKNDKNEVTAREFVFPENAATAYIESGTKFPSGAADFVISDSLTHNLKLEEGALYKFVETVAPSNYSTPDWTNGTFETNKNFIFYYAYKNTPDNALNGNITINEITSQGEIDIKNGHDISIKAKKTFSGIAENDNLSTGTSEVKLKLYWSYDNKDDNPTEFNPVDFGLASTYETEKTVTYNFATRTSDTVTWSDLPSGKNGEAVYYFVKEISYKIGNTTYTVNNEGKYVSGGTEGDFKPIYVNNGTNINNDTIEVNNSKGLIIQKLWVDTKGNTVTPPNENNSPMAINFDVYARTTSGNYIKLKLVDESDNPITLNSSNNYQYILPDTVKDINNNEYSLAVLQNFEVVEQLTDNQKTLLQGKYLENYDTNNIGNSVFQIINIEDSSPDTEVTVVKKWSDGNETHSSENVNVVLVQSLSSNLDDTAIQNLAESAPDTIKNVNNADVSTKATLNNSVNWSYTWSELPSKDTNNQNYYYYVVEKSVPDEYTAIYKRNDSTGSQSVEITNSKTTKLNVKKVWATGTDDAYKKEVTAKLMWKTDSSDWSDYTDTPNTVVLNESNNWKNYFVNLPESDTSGNKYSYKVVETKAGSIDNPAGMFTITYDDNNGNGVDFTTLQTQTITITNEVKKISLKVKKEWEGTPQSTIQIKIKRSVNTSVVPVVTTIANQPDVTTETTTNAFPYKNYPNLPQNLKNGDTVTITFNVGDTSKINGFNGGLGGNNDNDEWVNVPWEIKSNDINNGTASVTISITENISSPQIQLWWVNGYSKMKEGSETERADDDLTNYAPISITNITYTSNASSGGGTELSKSDLESHNSNHPLEFDQNLDTITFTFSNGDWDEVHIHFVGIDDKTFNVINYVDYNNSNAKFLGVEKESGVTNNELFGGVLVSNINGWGKNAWKFDGQSITFTIPNDATVNKIYFDGIKNNISASYTATYRPTKDSKPKPRQQTKQTANQNTNNSISSDMVLSKMMGGRSGTVKKIMSMKDVYENFAFGEIIQFFYDNANVDEILVETLTISADDEWQVSKEYPVYAPNGQPYYYWVEETSIEGYEISYSFNDNDSNTIYCINAENAGDSSVTIKNTQNTSEGTSLPEAGGNGTSPYTSAGMALIALSFTIPYIKHRKRRSRYSA